VRRAALFILGSSQQEKPCLRHAETKRLQHQIFEIDWTTVTMVIGMLASLIAVVFYARRDRD